VRVPLGVFACLALMICLCGSAHSSQRATACSGTIAVAQYQIEVARSKVECSNAVRVAVAAYESFVDRPAFGNHGVFFGFRCVFGLASTGDFSVADGPILFCKSWNRYVVGSAEPDDPPTKWFFERPALNGVQARRVAIGHVTSGGRTPWIERQSRSVNCSARLGRLVRRCDLRWCSGSTRYSVTLLVRAIPSRWGYPKIRVSGRRGAIGR